MDVALVIKQCSRRLYHLMIQCTCVVVLLALPSLLFAQAENEGYSESYLQRSVGARAIGLSGAYTSIVNEPNAIFFNPAGLSAQSESPTLSTMFSMLGFSRFQSTFAYSQNLTPEFGVGVGFNMMNSGTFIRRDALGRNLGVATNYVYSASVGAGYDIGGASFGLTGKYLANSVGALGLSGSGFAFDAGTRLSFADMFTFGMSVQNIGFMQWNNTSRTSETLPFMIRAGLSTEIPFESTEYEVRTAAIGEVETIYQPPINYLLLSVDGVFIRGNNNPTLMLGAEYSPTELFQVRGGISILGDTYGVFSLFPMSVFSGGASYRIAASELPFTMQIDYAALNDAIMLGGLSHHFSLFIEL